MNAISPIYYKYKRPWLTLMKVCQSCVFSLGPNSLFLDMRLLIFIANPLGSWIFPMTYFMALLCYFVNNQGRAFALMWSPLLFDSMIFFIAWLESSFLLQILASFSLSHLPSNIFHSVLITFFPICIVSNKCTIPRFL